MEKYLKARENPLGMPVVKYALSDISSLFKPHPKISTDVFESLEKHGLINPIIVVSLPVIQPKLDYYKIYHHVDKPKAKLYVHTGNNRYWAALELGYTHVDCYVCYDLKLLRGWEELTRINPRDFA